MAKQWRDQWLVPSSDGSKTYTVSQDSDGSYACSCPRWIFHREDCTHIEDVRAGRYPSIRRVPVPTPVFTVTDVQRATIFQRDGYGRITEVVVPPIAPGNDSLLLTVLVDLSEMGFGWPYIKGRYRQRVQEYQERSGNRRELSLNAAKSYVKDHGRAYYVASGETVTWQRQRVAVDPALAAYAPQEVDVQQAAIPVYNGVVCDETVRAVAW